MWYNVTYSFNENKKVKEDFTMKNFSMKQVKRRVQKFITFMSYHEVLTAVIAVISFGIACSCFFMHLFCANPEVVRQFFVTEEKLNRELCIGYAIGNTVIIMSMLTVVVLQYKSMLLDFDNKKVKKIYVSTTVIIGIIGYLCTKMIAGIEIAPIISVVLTELIVNKDVRKGMLVFVLMPIIGLFLIIQGIITGIIYVIKATYNGGKDLMKDFKEVVLN